MPKKAKRTKAQYFIDMKKVRVATLKKELAKVKREIAELKKAK